MTSETESTVYVVQVDHNKDLSDAKKYGRLRAVFSNLRKPYDTKQLVEKARSVLKDWNPGDYLLMIGDPTLGAVCMTTICDIEDNLNILSWDRNSFQYIPQRWDFGDQLAFEFNPAED